HRVALPAPGGPRELAEICGHVAGLALDRDRPLWEMWVIEGLHGNDAMSVLLKAHHAVVDGVGGANLLAQLCTTAPDAPAPAPAARCGVANPIQIAASGLIGAMLRPWRVARVVPATALTLAQTVLRAREGGRTMAAPFAGPATAFNGSFTRQRNIALTTLDL